jgi:hypothetical protein
MNGQKKTLANQLSSLVLPKLKGLSEKNAKKVLATVEKSVGDIAKKYVKLVQDQEKEAAKAKQVAQLMAKEAAPAAPKSAAKAPVKPKAKVIKK